MGDLGKDTGLRPKGTNELRARASSVPLTITTTTTTEAHHPLFISVYRSGVEKFLQTTSYFFICQYQYLGQYHGQYQYLLVTRNISRLIKTSSILFAGLLERAMRYPSRSYRAM
jgi:hypothetical protein